MLVVPQVWEVRARRTGDKAALAKTYDIHRTLGKNLTNSLNPTLWSLKIAKICDRTNTSGALHVGVELLGNKMAQPPATLSQTSATQKSDTMLFEVAFQTKAVERSTVFF